MQASKDIQLHTSDVPCEADPQQSRSESDLSSLRKRATAAEHPNLDSSSQMTELQLAQRQAAALAADRRAAAQARRDARSASGGSGVPTEHDAAKSSVAAGGGETEGAAVKAAVPEAAAAEAAAEAAKVTIRYAGLAPRSKARLEVLLNDWAAWHAENVQHSNDGSQLLVSIMRQVEVGFNCCCALEMTRPLLQFPTTEAAR